METILILYGWGSCARNWQKVKDGLESRGFKVFLPDLPGFGENPVLDRVWSIDDYVSWVKAYCQKQGLSRFVLVGHSFGGGLAAKFACRFPETVGKLILVDAAIVRVKNAKRELLAKIAKILNTFSFLSFYSFLRKAFYRFVASDYPGLEGAMRETYLGVVKRDLSDSLPGIKAPTLLIWGEKDKITPLKDAHLIKSRIPGASLETIPGIRHAPYLEAPDILAEKIANFIKS